ncbi:hypothetical protein SK128_008543, partial [Halocaridina rubra]
MNNKVWYHSLQSATISNEVLTYVEAGVSLEPGEEKFVSYVPLHHPVSSLSQSSLERLHTLLDDLSDVMTKPKVACRKRIRLGGNFCQKIADGD